MDELSNAILKLINEAKEPMGTVEIIKTVKSTSRSKVIFRLKEMRFKGEIEGKNISDNIKGTWIWWRKGVFG